MKCKKLLLLLLSAGLGFGLAVLLLTFWYPSCSSISDSSPAE